MTWKVTKIAEVFKRQTSKVTKLRSEKFLDNPAQIPINASRCFPRFSVKKAAALILRSFSFMSHVQLKFLKHVWRSRATTYRFALYIYIYVYMYICIYIYIHIYIYVYVYIYDTFCTTALVTRGTSSKQP